MAYEINVSKDGFHVFATAERSITTEAWAEDLLEKFKVAFPESEGYHIEVFKIEHTRKIVKELS